MSAPFCFLRLYYGVVLAILALILQLWTGAHAEWTEKYYSRGFYQVVRYLAHVGSLFNFLPGIIWAIMLLLVGPFLRAFAKSKNSSKALIHWFRFIVNRLGVLVFLFYVLWGYNYDRVPYVTQTQLQWVQLDSAVLMHEVSLVVQDLIDYGQSVHDSDTVVPDDLDWSSLSHWMQSELRSHGYPAHHDVDIASWRPPGLLLRWSTAGMYIPHALQGNIDGGLHPLQKPFTVLHEMSHSYGVTHEGIANLLAYEAGMRADDHYVRYSVSLAYFRYLLSDLRSGDEVYFQEVIRSLPEFVGQDLDSIRQRMQQFPDFLPKWRDAMYDQYLRAHGMSEGLYSYNLMVRLVVATRYAEGK